eukprot:gene672-3972_t
MTEGTRETKEVVDNQRIFSNPIALNSTKHVPSILSSQTVDKEVSSPQTISSQKIPWWKQAIAPMCLAVVGAGSFIISFRQSKRAARALNRELIDAAKQNAAVEDDAANLARRALGYATLLVSTFAIGVVGVTSVLMDVKSVPEFSEKMRSNVRFFSTGINKYVQAITNKYMKKRNSSSDEDEDIEKIFAEMLHNNNPKHVIEHSQTSVNELEDS